MGPPVPWQPLACADGDAERRIGEFWNPFSFAADDDGDCCLRTASDNNYLNHVDATII
jgi:hypothetical protein